MKNQNLKRVFIHEIGHYVARELNCELYNLGDGVEQIFIKTHNFSNSIDYLGGTTARKPKEYVENGEIKNVYEHTAVLLYGCLFQTMYLKSISNYEFRSCFNLKENANGKCDAKEFNAMSKHITGPIRKKIVEYTENKYLNMLNADQNHLQKIYKLEPSKFLKANDDGYCVHLELLKKELSYFIIKHKKYYSDYIQNIKRIKNEI